MSNDDDGYGGDESFVTQRILIGFRLVGDMDVNREIVYTCVSNARLHIFF